MSVGPKPNCPWRKRRRHPLDHAEKIAHVLCGIMFGTLAAAVPVGQMCFAVLITEKGSLWFPMAIAGTAMVVSGILSYFFGERFIDWMSENWHQFVRLWKEPG